MVVNAIKEGGCKGYMKKLVKSVVPLIESVFSDLTQSEKVIATFFIDNKEKDIDFSSQAIAERIMFPNPH